MANNITIELCAEDRARIDKLIAFMEQRIAQVDELYGKELPGHTTSDTTEEKTTKTETTEETPTPKAEPVKTASKEPTEEEPPVTVKSPSKRPTKDEPPVTVEDIRSKVLQLTGAGKKDDVRAIIHQYAPKVPDIPEDKLAEVLDKLNKLED